MKNIPYEDLLRIAGSGKPGAWAELHNFLFFSRAEVGLSSKKNSATRFVGNVEASNDVVWNWLKTRGYILFPHLGAAATNIGILLHPTENYLVAIAAYDTGDETGSLTVSGDVEEIEICHSWFKEKYSGAGSIITTIESFDERGNAIKTRKYIPKSSTQIAHQSFYPWLSISLEEYFTEFMKSDESVLVLFGLPGTGKSTFLRSLISHGSYNAWLAYAKDVVESPRTVSLFFRSAADILAYEDIDNHLGSRKDGNQLMSSILNASEGIVQHPGKKIVFSTNLPSIDRIDPALLRVGRCFDILQFRNLNSNEALAVRKDFNMADRDFYTKDSWSLAEILAKQSIAQQTINRFGHKVGFC